MVFGLGVKSGKSRSMRSLEVFSGPGPFLDRLVHCALINKIDRYTVWTVFLT